MNAVVFTGPTLAADAAHLELDAIYLPPVSQGDVYRVSRYRPKAIGIIDGFFERVPAVWHKEILWAMSHGIHVFGSASMGALRAAELTAFGMVGVGWVFEQYRDGILEDDDEVAVAHALEENGYRAHSEAMVNIRRTLAAAERVGIVSAATRVALENIGKRTFYADRTYITIVRRAFDEGVSVAELNAFEAWLPHGRIDQKRDDALTMLSAMRALLTTTDEPKRVQFHFEHTHLWEYARRQAGDLRLNHGTAEAAFTELVLDELRLDPDAYASSRQRALYRYMAAALTQGAVPNAEPEARTSAIASLQSSLGLDDDSLRRWLDDNSIDDTDFERLARDAERLERVERSAESELVVHLSDDLRLTGAYHRIRSRALDKRRTLEACGWLNPCVADAGLTEAELIEHYFVHVLGRPVPTDCAGYAQRLGFPDRAAFVRTLLREHLYQRLTRTGQDGARSDPHRSADELERRAAT
jgi:hypothetical protein